MYTVILNKNGSVIVSQKNEKGFVGIFSNVPSSYALCLKTELQNNFWYFQFKDPNWVRDETTFFRGFEDHILYNIAAFHFSIAPPASTSATTEQK